MIYLKNKTYMKCVTLHLTYTLGRQTVFFLFSHLQMLTKKYEYFLSSLIHSTHFIFLTL